jgi:predicted dehydrogenase
MKKLNLAVIGAGHWGPNLLRNFDNDTRVSVTKLCEKDLSRAKEVATHYRNLAVTDDIKDICNDNSIDAVVICTPTDTHFEVARACLLSGKHIFLEKPMATTSSECLTLIEIAREKNLKIFVGHVFLYNPAVQYIKKLIEKGELGQIVYIYAKRVNLGPVRRDVNALWDLAPHDIAIFNYWLGCEPLSCSAKGIVYINPPLHDVVFSSMRYPNNVFVNLHVSWIDPRKSREVVVVGTKKMVIFDDMNPVGPVQIYDKAVTRETSVKTVADTIHAFKVVLQEGDLVIPKVPAQEPLRNECQKFVECLNQDTQPLSDGENGLSVVRVLESLSWSLENGGSEKTISSSPPSTIQMPRMASGGRRG